MSEINRADLNLLIVFEALMSERHVGRAAQRLCLTQSAVSHALARLREMFNDPLFVRYPKGVEATPRALTLAPGIAEVLGRVRGLVNSGRDFDPSGYNRFTIGATDGAFPILLLPAIERIRRLAPNTEIRVRPQDPGSVAAALDRMDIDLAIMPMVHDAARFQRTPLRRIQYKGVSRRGHPAFAKRTPDLAAFLDLPHVAVSAKPETPSLVDQLLASIGVRRRIMFVVPQFLVAPLVIRTSDLVGILDLGVAELYARDPQMKIFDLNLGIGDITLDLIISSARKDEPGLSWLCGQIADAAKLSPETHTPGENAGSSARPRRPSGRRQ
jgi:DNA-binding transcriptional LysR family regulator